MPHPFLQPKEGVEREDDDLYELSGSDDDRLRHEFEFNQFRKNVLRGLSAPKSIHFRFLFRFKTSHVFFYLKCPIFLC